MTPTRRFVLAGTLGAATATAAAAAALAGQRTSAGNPSSRTAHALMPEPGDDQTVRLQAAIDAAAASGRPVELPEGVFRIGTLVLRPGTVLAGARGLTTLQFVGGETCLVGESAHGVTLQDLVIDGENRAFLTDDEEAALVRLSNCSDVRLSNVAVRRALANGITLTGCSGRITDCTVTQALLTGIRSIDAQGLDISHNTVTDCGNNAIQIWRSQAGEDGTIVSSNVIARIAAKGGGTGENGNGVNIFRAGGVIVSGNVISDCAYSAVRGNAASNLQMSHNTCTRLGEVALYAEFGFQGAIISGNIVDHAATGISVTNFNEGGRLAVVEGNLIRNLFRREHEAVDKRGEGIAVEADTVVSGNVVEGAPTCGIMVGWGPFMRNCLVSHNLVRDCEAGILVSADAPEGACLIGSNMVAGTRSGAIRAMRLGAPVGPELGSDRAGATALAVSGNVVS